MTDISLFSVWSDGSCRGNPGPGGFAAVLLDPQTNVILREVRGRSPDTTNQKMELAAAAEGILLSPEGSTVVVHTDSKYVVDGMTGWIQGWKRRGWKKADGAPVANKEFWIALDAACSKRDVRWVHVRGHRGIAMNEKVDKMAQAETAAVSKSKTSLITRS